MKRSHWTLLAVIVVCLSPSTVWAQRLGQMNPRPGHPALPPFDRGAGIDGRINVPPGVGLPHPAVPNIRDQDKRRDEQDHPNHAHIHWHLFLHGTHHPRGPSASEHGANVHPPKTVPAEAGLPAWESRFAPPNFRPPASGGGMTMMRGFSRWGGSGIFTGIGAAIAGAIGGIFGRKRES